MEASTGINQPNLAKQSMTTDSDSMDSKSDHIKLSSSNLSKYGFACFYRRGECKVEDDFWIREIEISLGGVEGSVIQKFKIPAKLCVELRPTIKIVNSDRFKISATSSSLNSIELLLQRAGWNQTSEDLAFISNHNQKGIFIASFNYENQEIPLGSGVSLSVNNDLCWIGMILVHPELRRQGIARSIMNACLEHARHDQNKSIIGLDATPLGKQVYDSLGFKDSFTIWRCEIKTFVETKVNSDVAVVDLEFEPIKKYLQELNYPERLGIIEILKSLPGARNIMAIKKGRIIGFALSRPGRLKPFIGPLIADSDKVAMIILNEVLSSWEKSGHASVFMDIPEQHLQGSVFFNVESPTVSPKQIPVNPVRSLVRMYQLVSIDEFENQTRLSPYSNSQLALKKALDDYELTAAFMSKEKLKILPHMFGTSGPEWS